jgi:chromate transport protein ChrA
MNMLQHAHSGLRWVVLALLLGAIINAFAKKGKGEFSGKDKMLSIMALAFTHVQVIVGLLIYFAGDYYKLLSMMSNSTARLYGLEHPLTMLIGAVLITIGYSKSKRKTDNAAKFKTIAIWYTIGLVLILSRIPWPFMVETAGWF